MKTPDYAAMTDEQLACLSLSDGKAMDFLLDKYKNTVRMKARAYYLMGADRDDIIQEGMIGLYIAIRNFNGEKRARFKPFAELIIERRILSAVKSASRRKHSPLNNYVSMDKPIYTDSGERTLAEIVPTEGGDPEELMIERETAAQAENLIMDALSPFEKEVARLYLTGLGYREIAAALGKTPKSVDNALMRIKKKAAKLIR